MAADDRLIVALDTPTLDDARALVTKLGDSVSFYKVGLSLVIESLGGGPALIPELKAMGKKVFLDVKVLDIANTVEQAIEKVSRLDVDFVTLHAIEEKTIKAALAGLKNSRTKLLGVTVLTSLDQDDLRQQGTNWTPEEAVLRRALMAHQVGLHGVVASDHEAERIRAFTPPEFFIVTPGIRLAGYNGGDDQHRIVTPGVALARGATHLVVGRPISQAFDPRAAADQFRGDMDKTGRA